MLSGLTNVSAKMSFLVMHLFRGLTQGFNVRRYGIPIKSTWVSSSMFGGENTLKETMYATICIVRLAFPRPSSCTRFDDQAVCVVEQTAWNRLHESFVLITTLDSFKRQLKHTYLIYLSYNHSKSLLRCNYHSMVLYKLSNSSSCIIVRS